MAAVITADLVLLTCLLYFSGGPTNPFSFFYLVNLALAAILLPGRWALALAMLAVICFAGFFAWGYVPIASLEEAWHATGPLAGDIRKQGLIVAFAACALINTYFISRVAQALAQREEELRRAEQRRAQSERLEALATLAAGAGHELASPLSTIAVIAKELTKHLEGANVPQSVLEDVALIRSELDHCRVILNRMSAHAGQVVGEQVGVWTLEQIVAEVVGGLRRADRVSVYGLETTGSIRLQVPLQALALAIRGLLQNALDASQPSQSVELHVLASRDRITFRIVDYGCGMSADVLQRAGEPFFTTKEPGQGMGLGLFLTRSVLERLGGQLTLRSRAGQGTTVEATLPRTDVSGSAGV
jgi:two-component system sensor histidine kinase RegB